MEESGRGAAVEQLTARGMEYQSPQWGAIEHMNDGFKPDDISIPAMGGNSQKGNKNEVRYNINPRNGGQ